MNTFTRALYWIDRQPDFVIQAILAVVLLATGLYIAGPWYVGGTSTAIGVALEADVIRIFTGLCYTAGGVLGVVGLAKNLPRIRYWGTMIVFLCYTFMLLLRLLTFGFTPFFWAIILAVALIAAVMHVRESYRRENLNG